MQIASVSVRTFLSNQKLTKLEEEIENIKWEITGLSEVQIKGEDQRTLKSGHNFSIYAGQADASVGGTGFIIHREHTQQILDVKSISTRVTYLTLK